jgi:aminoglycoside phosphotransferase (APT) family kinase protein
VIDQDRFDPTAILKALGLSVPTRSTPVQGGADTLIWRIEYGSQRYALRVFRADQAAMTQREVIAMNAAGSVGLPVPEVHAEGIWGDRPALLLSWMPGRPLTQEFALSPWRAWTHGLAIGRMQAAIHRVPAPAKLIHPVPWVEWNNPDKTLRDRLLALSAGAEALLHLDLHPMNVLAERGHITAVLDWANARCGDPRADLARTASILRFGPLDSVPSPVSGLLRQALIAGWRRGYREIAGPVRGMAPFYVWAGMVMVRDLAPRLGRPDLPWLTPTFLERVQDWTAGWRARADLPLQSDQ